VALAQSSSGSLANLDLMAAGRAESAIVQADLAEAANAGRDDSARGALAGRVRALANLLAASVHLLVRPEVPLAGLADLAGRRVGFEEAGSGTLPLARRLLAGVGLAERDLEPVFLARTPMVKAMATGALDALLLIGAWPLPAVDELVREWGARLLPVKGPGVDELVRELPYLGYHLIPFGAYPGQPAIETLGVPLLWLVAADLDPELVEAIADALWRPESQARLRAGHPQGRELALEQAAQGLSVPLHPGAERFYRARGVLREP
jgi:TRAP transporter TAXI family solute receptor